MSRVGHVHFLFTCFFPHPDRKSSTEFYNSICCQAKKYAYHIYLLEVHVSGWDSDALWQQSCLCKVIYTEALVYIASSANEEKKECALDSIQCKRVDNVMCMCCAHHLCRGGSILRKLIKQHHEKIFNWTLGSYNSSMVPKISDSNFFIAKMIHDISYVPEDQYQKLLSRLKHLKVHWKILIGVSG